MFLAGALLCLKPFTGLLSFFASSFPYLSILPSTHPSFHPLANHPYRLSESSEEISFNCLIPSLCFETAFAHITVMIAPLFLYPFICLQAFFVHLWAYVMFFYITIFILSIIAYLVWCYYYECSLSHIPKVGYGSFWKRPLAGARVVLHCNDIMREGHQKVRLSHPTLLEWGSPI